MEFHEFLICVATVNGPERLERFLKSIKEFTFGFDYKVSITDDCSDPHHSSRNYELAVQYGCFYTRNQQRSGVPYSWNRATELGNCKYLVIANDDIEVCPGWLSSYKQMWEANSHLKLGVMAWPACGKVEEKSKLTNFSVDIDHSHISTPIVACAGYLFAVPRDLFMLVNKFDERYFATWEEIDFGAKLCMVGYKSIGLNGPLIYHQGGASFSDPINQHPAMKKQSLAQTQWIDKWSHILNISKDNRSDQTLIKLISDSLTSKIPFYKANDFTKIEVKEPVSLIRENDIHGWFDFHDIYEEAISLAKENDSIVEVGSWLGKSATYMGQLINFSKKKVNFYCIDFWNDEIVEVAYREEILNSIQTGVSMLDKFLANLDRYGVKNFVKPIKAYSWDAAQSFNNNSCIFVFLDANHEYDYVKRDIETWWPKVKKGGIMAGHDYTHSPGVKKAVDNFFKRKNIKVIQSKNSWKVYKND